MLSDSSVKNPSLEINTTEYTGPFRLLADLVAKRKPDITAFALAEVTSEFLEYIARLPSLSQATEFLVIAAALLDIKAAWLLPGMVETEEDLELLGAQDLLISRLIQYQIYKEAAGFITYDWDEYGSATGRIPGAEPLLRGVLASLKTTIDYGDLVRRATGAIFATPPQVLVAHLHSPSVSITEQSQILTERLRQAGSSTFHQLATGTKTLPVIVSRFSALLDMCRRDHLSFDQEYPLGELVITQVGKSVDSTETVESDDFNAALSDAEGEWQ